MSYQVLARKYRPSNFQEMEGQEHVLRALINSLTQNRLHHAYLFTGTRGTGKTTIARILAKCFNCETGVTATPCGECSTCLEIAQGRSVDLIEVDAASRTRVEDTRELLDNVQYMPTRNRFKVYLIDEVHMLSNHSFNALLKTLEEPPEHVKFLLATTDPKKLPVTVLSRCLQFNLKNLSPERVVNYLQKILQQEEIPFEEPALWQLGRAADGSMRDALSLTDQAISFGENSLREADVRTMLGTIDHREVYELLDALIAKDAGRLLGKIAALAEFGPDFEMLLAELLSVLHRVAVAQAVPDGIDNSQGDRELVLAVASSMGREDVQLYYQIALIGQRDLPLAPDPRDGFEMVMLRMLSFAPEQMEQGPASGSGNAATGSTARSTRAAPAGSSASPEQASSSPVADILSRIRESDTAAPARSTERAPAERKPVEKAVVKKVSVEAAIDDSSDEIPWDDSDGVTSPAAAPQTAAPKIVVPEKVVAETPATTELDLATPVTDTVTDIAVVTETAAVTETTATPATGDRAFAPEDWTGMFDALNLTGVTRTLASNCIVSEVNDSSCVLVLNEHHASLWNQTHEGRIGKALTKLLGREMSLRIDVGATTGETPAEAKERFDEASRAQAVNAIENDENVQQLLETFDGTLRVETIVPRSRIGE